MTIQVLDSPVDTINVVGQGATATAGFSTATLNIPGLQVLNQGVTTGFANTLVFPSGGLPSVLSNAITVTIEDNAHIIYLSPSGGDDAPATWSAYQTLYANGRGGVICYDSGIFSLRSSPVGNASVILMKTNHPGMITLRGQGKFATQFYCTTACNCLIYCQTGVSGLTKLITLEDFSINVFNKTYNGSVGVVFEGYGVNGYEDIIIRRVDTCNLPAGSQYPWRSSVVVALYGYYAGTKSGQTLYTADRITVEDCNFGIDNYVGGYGGNYGVQIQADYGGGPATGDTTSHAGQDDWLTNCRIDNINITRCIWDGGITVKYSDRFGGGTQWPGTGFIIGGSGAWGENWNVTDCRAIRSGDDSFEINSGISITMTRCVGDSGNFENFFFVNQAGMPSDRHQVTRMLGCKTEFNYYIPEVTGNNAGGVGNCSFASYATSHCGYGDIIIENHIGDIKVVGSCKSLTVKNLTHRIKEPQITLTANSTNSKTLFSGAGVSLGLYCGHTDVNIYNLNIDDYKNLSYGGLSGCTASLFGGVGISAAASINLNVDKANIGSHCVFVPGSTGSGTSTWISCSIPTHNTIVMTDTLFREYGSCTVSNLRSGYICDSGNRTEVSNPQFMGYIDNGSGGVGNILTVTAVTHGLNNLIVGSPIGGAGVTSGTIISTVLTGSGGIGTYTVNKNQHVASEPMTSSTATPLVVNTLVSSDPTTEKRFIWQGHYELGFSGCGGTSPFIDTCWFMASTPGNTTVTGHKAGIVLKRQYPKRGGGTTYLECYITDNGTNTLLKIDKVVASVRTNLVSHTSPTRISTSTKFWVMGSIKGNVVTVTYKNTTPGSYLSQFTAGVVDQVSYTLTGYAEISTFGENQLGWGGFSWVPADINAVINQLSANALTVYSGKGMNDITFNNSDNYNSFIGVNFTDPTNADKWIRFKNPLYLTNFNFQGVSAVATQDIASGLPASVLQNIVKTGSWITTLAPASITVTTGTFTYINQDGCNEDVALWGGTIASISISRDKGISFQQVAASNYSNYLTTLAPSDQITIVSSVAPTMKKIPVY